jgi:hypothetical protein
MEQKTIILRWRRFQYGGIIRWEPTNVPPYIVIDQGATARDGYVVKAYADTDASLTGGRLYTIAESARLLGFADAKAEAQRIYTRAVEQGEDVSAPAYETLQDLPTPFGPKYQERTERGGVQGDECVLCGRKIGNKKTTRFFRVVDGGTTFAAPSDDAGVDGGDMGYFPVGPECAKTLPAEWAASLDGFSH